MPTGHTPLIVFSHANSFPAGTYSLLFRSLRARGFAVKAVEKFGHDPRYPVSSNWPHLVQQLADFAGPEIEKHRGPVFLVGHSLGGFLSAMCAAQHPQLGGRGVQGVLLLDAPLLGGWRARTLALIKGVQLVGSVSPGKVSRRRRHQWPSAEDALAHFQHKRAFAHWHPQVLRDYIAHGTHDQPTAQGVRRVLGFDRDIETAIYNTLPHHLDRLLRRHPLRCPAAFIGGTGSQEMQQVGMAMTHRLVGREHPQRLQMLEGSHLFPMEKPVETAAAIENALLDLLQAHRDGA
ncbi:alpha/beta hydrolase [Hydrogenophaga sp. OTU3427]|uniref:alpha/beta hydrolase n=1 Tax=Hydrogenophaga sp. OTU3427 TaxID=3043856 RepID=UPI00313C7F90